MNNTPVSTIENNFIENNYYIIITFKYNTITMKIVYPYPMSEKLQTYIYN